MAAPPRGNIAKSVYFITAATTQRLPLFRKDSMARLFVEVLIPLSRSKELCAARICTDDFATFLAHGEL